MATLADPSAPSAVPAVAIAAVELCPSCDTPLAGEYCHACGERRHHDERFSLRHFVAEVWEDVFDLDSRALRSVRLLLTKPGFLTLEALRGRRRPYLGALRMYLTVFAALMFFSALIPKHAAQQNVRAGDAITRAMKGVVHGIANTRHLTDAAAEAQLADVVGQHESWLAVLIPLIFAAELFVLFRRRRRWYGEHLVAATHFATFNFIVGIALMPLALLHPSALVTGCMTVVTFLLIVVYLALSVQRVYGSRRAASFGWALLLLVGFSLAQTVVGALSLVTATVQLLVF
jgi:hypothetical protein